ncbi:hypothetical protein D3C81_1980100 [compost metagenome]
MFLKQVRFQGTGRVQRVGLAVRAFVRFTGFFLPHLAVVVPPAGRLHFGGNLSEVIRAHRLVKVHPTWAVTGERQTPLNPKILGP